MKRPNTHKLSLIWDDEFFRVTHEDEQFELADWDIDYGESYRNSIAAVPWGEQTSSDYVASEKAVHYARVRKINLDRLISQYDRWVRAQCD